MARAPQNEGLTVGFGWGLYGFFAAAIVWIALYFLWAWYAARRDREEGR